MILFYVCMRASWSSEELSMAGFRLGIYKTIAGGNWNPLVWLSLVRIVSSL